MNKAINLTDGQTSRLDYLKNLEQTGYVNEQEAEELRILQRLERGKANLEELKNLQELQQK